MPTPDFILRLRRRIGNDLLPLVGVSAVVVGGSEILLQRRADDGRWATPGGVLEPGEEPAAAVVREVREETGLHVVTERMSSVVAEEPTSYHNGDRVQFLDIAFRCRVVGGTLRADGEETLEVRWFPLDGLPDMLPHVLHRIRCAPGEGAPWYTVD